MNELEVKRVPFMGTDLMAAKDESGTIWAGVRWMCDGMGMSEGQRKRQIASIQTDHLLSKGGSNLILPTAGGKQSVLCLKLDFVPLWLAKINITPAMQAETPELAERLEAYQLKAKDVLAAAFLPKKARGGESKPMTDYQQMMAEKWERDHALQEARIYIGMAKRYRGTIHFYHHDGSPDTKMQTYWTQKGRMMIHNILTGRGIVALMDRERA